MTQKPKSLAKTLLLTGLLAGTLDILAAVLHYFSNGGDDPVNILRYIASGVFGKEAFGESIIMPVYGLAFHYIIAFGWTLLFFGVYRKAKLRSLNKYIAGILYGLFVWLVMNLVVLPLSNVPASSPGIGQVITGIVILMLAVGLPVSVGAHAWFIKK